jgi:PKD repeat protein
MKKLMVLLGFSMMVYFMNGCKSVDVTPKPKAEFTFTVLDNGVVQFNNLSTDATSYEWDFGNNVKRTITDKSLTYQYLSNKSFQVGLTATSSSGSDVIVKTVNVNNIKGRLLIYKRFTTRDRNISVYVDGTFHGSINGNYYYSTAPDCGNIYSVTIDNLSEGSHKIEAKETGVLPYSWSYTATITGGICNTSGLTL